VDGNGIAVVVSAVGVVLLGLAKMIYDARAARAKAATEKEERLAAIEREIAKEKRDEERAAKVALKVEEVKQQSIRAVDEVKRQALDAAVEAKKVARTAEVAAVKVDEVAQTLQAATANTDAKLDEMQKTSVATHILVNSNMGAQLKISAVALRELADALPNAKRMEAAELAEKMLAEHIAKQAVVDSRPEKG